MAKQIEGVRLAPGVSLRPQLALWLVVWLVSWRRKLTHSHFGTNAGERAVSHPDCFASEETAPIIPRKSLDGAGASRSGPFVEKKSLLPLS
jgi:hypothetical protein